MTRITVNLILCGLLLPGAVRAQPKNDSVFSWARMSGFTFTRVEKESATKASIASSAKAFSLFIFLSPECPISKNYTLTVNELHKKYSNEVDFYGCITGKGFTETEIKSFLITYKITFPLLVDGKQKFTKYVGATVTPEVILVNKKGQMVYKGAIDDWILGLGKQRLTATNHYLQNAIEALLDNKPVPLKRTTPYGCLINDF